MHGSRSRARRPPRHIREPARHLVLSCPRRDPVSNRRIRDDRPLRRPRTTTEIYGRMHGPLPVLFPGAPFVADDFGSQSDAAGLSESGVTSCRRESAHPVEFPYSASSSDDG